MQQMAKPQRARPDGSVETAAQQLGRIQQAPASDLGAIAVGYDWGDHPEQVLGWLMAQKSIDLGAALLVFFNGDPERYNYLHKRDVPVEHQQAARVLDNICLRINSGFYLAAGREAPDRSVRLRKWLAIQHLDRSERVSGRWVLDEAIVSAIWRGPPPAAPQRTERARPRGASARMIRSLAMGLVGMRSPDPARD